MEENKLTAAEAEAYWKSVHSRDEDDLARVCFPGKPAYFNRFFDRIEKFAVGRALGLAGSVRGKSVLDIGCGTARWLDYYSGLGASVTGIDLCFDAAAACSRKGHAATAASAACLPFKDASFDLVNCVAVLLHLPPEFQESAVREIERVLKPGGAALLIENTSTDSAPHVFPRQVQDWKRLFGNCSPMLIESHCYIRALRAVWGLQRRLNSPRLGARLEAAAVAIEYPLEFSLMRMFAGKSEKNSLQHIMIFKRK